jgi:hypothetical protein
VKELLLPAEKRLGEVREFSIRGSPLLASAPIGP